MAKRPNICTFSIPADAQELLEQIAAQEVRSKSGVITVLIRSHAAEIGIGSEDGSMDSETPETAVAA